ncbi:MAG: GDP-L-fucose synthase [Candidatus Anstonellaceae archaeon]
MNKEAKVFVAGGTGMVGTAIIRKLLEKGYNNIISNYHKRKPEHVSFSSVKFYPLDLTSQSDTEAFFAEHKPDYVFLAAAKVGGILANNTYKADFIYENMAIALNVIHSAYKYGVKKLLNLGSSCIYPKHAPQPMKEEHLLTGSLEPTNEPYAIAKIAAIKLCRYYNEQYGTNFLSVIPANLYGPNDNFDLYTSHVLPSLIRKMFIGKCLENNNWTLIRKDLYKYPIERIDGSAPKKIILNILKKYGIILKTSYECNNLYSVTVNILGTGEPYREFLHVEDLSDCCVFLMENIDANKFKNISENYLINVGLGYDIKIKDLALMIKKIIGFNGQLNYTIDGLDGMPRKIVDITNLVKIGWEPKISLEEGIIKTYKWYKEMVSGSY